MTKMLGIGSRGLGGRYPMGVAKTAGIGYMIPSTQAEAHSKKSTFIPPSGMRRGMTKIVSGSVKDRNKLAASMSGMSGMSGKF